MVRVLKRMFLPAVLSLPLIVGVVLVYMTSPVLDLGGMKDMKGFALVDYLPGK